MISGAEEAKEMSLGREGGAEDQVEGGPGERLQMAQGEKSYGLSHEAGVGSILLSCWGGRSPWKGLKERGQWAP